MRAAIINRTPAQWLSEIGEPADKVREVLDSFEFGATLAVCAYRAPHVFFRFHGRQSKRPIYRPNYWVDGSVLGRSFGRASQFEGVMSDQEICRVAKTYYRELTAICHNWNPLRDSELWKIELQANEAVEGLEGPTRSQPTFAATATEPAANSMLPGSGQQVYLDPKTPFVCTPVSWNAL